MGEHGEAKAKVTRQKKTFLTWPESWQLPVNAWRKRGQHHNQPRDFKCRSRHMILISRPVPKAHTARLLVAATRPAHQPEKSPFSTQVAKFLDYGDNSHEKHKSNATV